jgi:hypothetical protein
MRVSRRARTNVAEFAIATAHASAQKIRGTTRHAIELVMRAAPQIPRRRAPTQT